MSVIDGLRVILVLRFFGSHNSLEGVWWCWKCCDLRLDRPWHTSLIAVPDSRLAALHINDDDTG